MQHNARRLGKDSDRPIAPIPENESTRLAALAAYAILDTPSAPCFDHLTALAAQICEAPIALISFSDHHRQWLESHHGLDAAEIPRYRAFCGYAILGPEPLQIQDARQDPRFRENALVTGEARIRSYAAVPLYSKCGAALGTLCVLDRRPRLLPASQILALKLIAAQVVQQLELRKLAKELHVQSQMFAKTQEIARIGGWELNLQSNRITWTDETYRIHGVSRENYTPTMETALAFYAPGSLPSIRNAVERAISTGTPYDLELQIITRAGDYRWVRAMGQRDDRGEGHERLYGVFQDIHDRCELEMDVLVATQDERARIGADLHDGLGQDLAGIALLVNGLAKKTSRNQGVLDRELQQIEHHVRDAVGTCRSLSAGLCPVDYKSGGLLAALGTLFAQFERAHGTTVKIKSRTAEIVVPELVADHLYRIAQEAVSNAIRHGRSSEIIVTVDCDQTGLSLSIADNGKGIGDFGSITGSGLRIMRYRAHQIGASLEFACRRGGGAIVSCQLSRQALNGISQRTEASTLRRAHGGR